MNLCLFSLALLLSASENPTSLEGRWGEPGKAAEVTVTKTADGGFSVKYDNGRGPFVGKLLAAGSVEVRFVDDGKCCTGKIIDADTIKWSNGSTWKRAKVFAFEGRWGEPGKDPELTVTKVDGGYAVKYDNGRGPFVGKMAVDGGVDVRFVDDGGCCTGKFEDQDTIKWSNGGTWKRGIAPEFEGRWGEPGKEPEITVTKSGAGYSVKFDNGRGPFVGKLFDWIHVDVRFVDDGDCCTGKFEGAETIKWSNGGSWKRATKPTKP